MMEINGRVDRQKLANFKVFIFFVFPYEVERLVDVCVCKLTRIADMYIIANGYHMRIRCKKDKNSDIVK